MTQLERQIRAVQRRLWFNRWLTNVSWTVCCAAGLFAIIVLVQRLYDLRIETLWIAAGFGAAAIISSWVWTVATGENTALAAAKLDEAAGLRERLSSGHYCIGLDDPFARACVADAERVSSTLSPRQHVRVRIPRQLTLACVSILAAVLATLVRPGLLKGPIADDAGLQQALVDQTQTVIARKLEEVRRLAETNPALQEMREELDKLVKPDAGALVRPGDIRHEAVKKIDHLADVLRSRRRAGDYETVKALRKMMRRLKPPESEQAPTRRLARALATGDFKAAREEMNALREQLATLKADADRDLVNGLSKKLDELAKQLDRAANNEMLAKKLAQASIKKERIQRLLHDLKKRDLDQLREELEKKGWSQQQIRKLAEQLGKQEQAGRLAGKLAQYMRRGALATVPTQGAELAAGLRLAADQLSQLEQLEQEVNQIDATLAALQSTRNAIDSPCSLCRGRGQVGGQPCGRCRGTGIRPGSGRPGGFGQGSGGLAPEETTDVSFKTKRAKVHTGRGAIIGHFLVDAEQVKGDASSRFAEIITAAERDASDRINRDRVPRQYQKAVKTYFSTVDRLKAEAPLDNPDTHPSKRKSNEPP
ncbi:MAG: hypothetical protein ACE5HE_08055 [Phycisphaerae bacterium]